MSDDEIIDMVRDADLDWHAGYPVGEDEANRYATLARAAAGHESGTGRI